MNNFSKTQPMISKSCLTWANMHFVHFNIYIVRFKLEKRQKSKFILRDLQQANGMARLFNTKYEGALHFFWPVENSCSTLGMCSNVPNLINALNHFSTKSEVCNIHFRLNLRVALWSTKTRTCLFIYSFCIQVFSCHFMVHEASLCYVASWRFFKTLEYIVHRWVYNGWVKCQQFTNQRTSVKLAHNEGYSDCEKS